jgi:hypothetical protein
MCAPFAAIARREIVSPRTLCRDIADRCEPRGRPWHSAREAPRTASAAPGRYVHLRSPPSAAGNRLTSYARGVCAVARYRGEYGCASAISARWTAPAWLVTGAMDHRDRTRREASVRRFPASLRARRAPTAPSGAHTSRISAAMTADITRAHAALSARRRTPCPPTDVATVRMRFTDMPGVLHRHEAGHRRHGSHGPNSPPGIGSPISGCAARSPRSHGALRCTQRPDQPRDERRQSAR